MELYPLWLAFQLRILHLIVTIALIWTKFDSIASTVYFTDNDAYNTANNAYVGTVAMSVIFLLLRFALLPLQRKPSIVNVISLATDGCALFFILWIILDGLPWYSYLYVFVFCR